MLEENFVEMLGDSIKKNWALPAFSNYNESALTYGQVAEGILWLHYVFQKVHIKRGDKIALIGRNSTNWAIVYLATVTYGAVIVPVLPDFHVDDFHHIVNHSDSLLLFVAENIYENIDAEKMPGLEAIFSLTDLKVLYSKKKTIPKTLEKADEHYLEKFDGTLTPENFTLETVSNAELSGILYTSGTSGFSKGVMLPNNSLAANVRFARNSIDLKAGDPILSFLPMAHTFGCTFDFLFPFAVGCHMTFLGQIPSPKILVQALERIRPRLILSVPLVIEKIYRNRLKPKVEKGAVKTMTKIPGLKNVILKKIRQKLVDVFGGNFIEIVIGGAALNEEVEDFLRKIKFPFTVGYGMTECGPLISYTPFPRNKKQAVGQLMDTLEIRIDSSVTGATDGSGEIQVRGENVMTGYYKNEEATKEAIDEDGWLHTGDVGMMDGDGFIYIKGRHKSILLGPSGQNIYPEEIEARLNNMPYVEEALVIEKDKKLVAYVYPTMDAVDAEGLSEQDLQEKIEINRNQINEQLPAYSRITKIELYPEEFEKTPTKKIKRFLYTSLG
ncbi:MAG: AMP-binding protein [Candidatus Aminicenantes bacterium]|nr:AMP-binding protein [Candidatus Aminicenantes bacterium]NIM80795.1 AMP-binding protein [Candidatus Aminicenantes bacterium]NIN20178.1 AMP-binding protein [Candidatus Aminicenantes bacterium]NIN43957.1 AMP-binding protein [Candidatus Aminicenantes bacterium]NIN86766.1 AMP-binding protein [Candidatus Aminicenantes bacterium]